MCAALAAGRLNARSEWCAGAMGQFSPCGMSLTPRKANWSASRNTLGSRFHGPPHSE